MSKLIPVAIVLVALLGGAGAGHFLKPAPAPADDHAAAGDGAEAAADGAPEAAADASHGSDPADGHADAAGGPGAVVTFRDGFIVPVMRDGQVWSHVVLQLGVEAEGRDEATILLREPVLRDALTEALFLHGSLGGFDGDFTEPDAMARLRSRLDGVVSGRLGDPTARVLIASLARQST